MKDLKHLLHWRRMACKPKGKSPQKKEPAKKGGK
jgi:hypothetical protein